MGEQDQPIGHWLSRTCCIVTWTSTPLDGAHRNALLLAHWPVRQKPNRVSSVKLSCVKFSSVTSLCTRLNGVCAGAPVLLVDDVCTERSPSARVVAC